jgi:hypothetical protein
MKTKTDTTRKATRRLLATATAALLASGCLYTHIQRPLDQNFSNTELGTKVGRAHSRVLLWLVAWGDAGTQAAARDGGISVIKHADFEVHSVLFGAYSRVTTVVYGD